MFEGSATRPPRPTSARQDAAWSSPRRTPGSSALLAEQAPELAGHPLQEVPGGRDNAVVRVGDALAVRLPRTAAAAMLLRNEQRWLPRLGPALPLPVPVPVVAGRPGAGFPHAWSVVPWRRGRTADRQPYDEDRLADDLTAFLAALHVPAPADAPANPVRGVPLAGRRDRFARSVARHPQAPALQRELGRLASVPGPAGPAVWVHGDLHARNVVVDERRVVAVIDFGDLHAGDRAIDLAWTWMLLGAPARERVRDGLRLDSGTWARARGWALVLGGLMWEIGTDEGDAEFLRTGTRALDRAARG